MLHSCPSHLKKKNVHICACLEFDRYTKENLTVSFWRKEKEGQPIDIHKDPESTEMLVYIDRERTTDGEPADEYIPRMNHGIHDALKEGVPKDYVDEVMRKFIPAQGQSELHEQPLQQPLVFADEKWCLDEENGYMTICQQHTQYAQWEIAQG